MQFRNSSASDRLWWTDVRQHDGQPNYAKS